MTVTVFLKDAMIAQGPAENLGSRLRDLQPLARASDLLAFDDETGAQVDIDLSGGAAEAGRGRGRPALGVQAREVTLLPRHWDWLARQRGGASATLRKLVEAAMRQGRSEEDRRDAAFRFLNVMAGNLPHFEDAVREVYAGNRVGYDHFSHGWPGDIRDHGRALAWPETAPETDARA